MDSKKWFKEAKFGMMVHFGLYSLIAGEWKGKRTDRVAEWAQHIFKIPNAEYEKLADAFNPIYFDAEEYVKLAKEVGMQYIVVTAKHHDGFALYHSKVDKYNVVDATPYGRDIIKEFADACKKHNLKLGLYYSQEMDWHEPNGGGRVWPPDENLVDTHYWENNWDFPSSNKNFYQYFKDKALPQVEELLTNYGDICLIWFDNPWTITPEQSDELFHLVKKLQPNCLVNSRIGNGRGDYTSTGDNEYLDIDVGDKLYECPATLNDNWGYKAYDDNWKDAKRVLELKKQLNDCGINYLLNVGPDNLGRIPGPCLDILREVGKELNKK